MVESPKFTMQFTTTVAELRSVLDTLKTVISTLDSGDDNILIYPHHGNLRIHKTGFESEMDLIVSVSKIKGTTNIVLPLLPLSCTLKNLDDTSNVQFSCAQSSGWRMDWTIVSSGLTIRGVGTRPKKMGRILKKDNRWKQIKNWDVFTQSIRSVVPFVSDNELRLALTGIYLDSDWLCATNGHLLAKEKIAISFPGLILPESFAQILCKARGQEALWRPVEKGRNCPLSIAFLVDDQLYQTELIESEFPEYNRIIPEESNCLITMRRSEVISALTKLLPITNNQSHLVQWQVGHDSVFMIADAEADVTGEVSISGSHSGDEITIGLNAAYALTVLESLRDEQIMVKLQNQFSAIIWTDAEDETGSLRLLMPVKLE